MLKDAGFLVVVVTNQPDVGRGLIAKEQVESMHQKMKEMLPLDDVKVCFDDGELVNSEWRKPNPGMILTAARENDIDLSQSYMVGDRWRDVEAGRRAGLTTIFIDYGYVDQPELQPDYIVSSLLEAARCIINNENLSRKGAYGSEKP